MTVLAKVDIGASVQKLLDALFTFVPKLLLFLLVLLIVYIVARVIKGVVTKALQSAGLDRALHSGQTGQYVEKLSPGASPSALIGTIAFYVILLAGLSIAVSAAGIPALTSFIATITSYLPNVIAAIIILVVAGAIATAVGGLVTRTMGDTPTGKIVGTVVPVLVMGIAVFMVLIQLKIAPQIVIITYASLMGAFALGLALAFGLGGREQAADLLRDARQKGREQKDQVRGDLELGKQRGQQDAQQAKEKAQEKAGQPQQQPGGTTQRYSSSQ